MTMDVLQKEDLDEIKSTLSKLTFTDNYVKVSGITTESGKAVDLLFRQVSGLDKVNFICTGFSVAGKDYLDAPDNSTASTYYDLFLGTENSDVIKHNTNPTV